MYRFQTYSERNHTSEGDLILFAALMFVSGIGLGIVAASPLRAATCLIAGVCIAHTAVIYIDCIADPTNHNLFPFEFVFYVVLGSPAYLGAAIARALRRYSSATTGL